MMTVESFVKQAQQGNKAALEQVVTAIQDDIYYLALRMLANQEDARDATQEILIKVITKLSTFQFKSAFKTWVFRVASNHLLNAKKILAKDPGLSFEAYREDLEQDLVNPTDWEKEVEYPLLLNEVRIGCTLAMLLCLKPPHRLAYIFGDIFELDHNEASEILNISKANYRKRLSRARARVVAFTQQSCGLIGQRAKCACDKKLTGAIGRERVTLNHIQFADQSKETYQEIKLKIAETKADLKILALQNAIPRFKNVDNFADEIETIMARVKFI